MIDLWNKTFLFTPLFLSYVHMKAIGFFPLLVLATVWNGSEHFRSGNNAKLDSKYQNSAGFWALLNSTWNTLVETVYDFYASNNNVSCETGFKSFLSRCVTGEDKTWTRGPWTPTLDRVHGPPVMDRVHGQFFFNNEKWTKIKIVQKKVKKQQ